MKKLLALLLAVLMLASCLTGCGKGKDSDTTPPADENTNQPVNTDGAEPDSTPDDTSADTPREDFMFTDSCGREVQVDGEITKIVPSGPLAQIMLFAIAPDMFVGVSSNWDDTAAALLDKEYYELPVIGQLYGGKGEVNLEEVAKLAPQLLIDMGEAKGSIVEDLDALQEQIGVTCVHIDATLSTMPEAYRTLGQLLGREEKGEELAAYCEQWLKTTDELLAKVGSENLVKAIYCVGEDGLSVLAKTSFHAEIIDLLTNNVAVVDDVSSKGSGNAVDMEQLLLWDPDFIIFSPDGGYENAKSDETWQQLKAIANGNFVEVPYGPYNWAGSPPSVQRYLSLIWLPAVLYPDYVEYDVYEEVAKYFELFYHCELTREQYDELTANAFIG